MVSTATKSIGLRVRLDEAKRAEKLQSQGIKLIEIFRLGLATMERNKK